MEVRSTVEWLIAHCDECTDGMKTTECGEEGRNGHVFINEFCFRHCYLYATFRSFDRNDFAVTKTSRFTHNIIYIYRSLISKFEIHLSSGRKVLISTDIRASYSTMTLISIEHIRLMIKELKKNKLILVPSLRSFVQLSCQCKFTTVEAANQHNSVVVNLSCFNEIFRFLV